MSQVTAHYHVVSRDRAWHVVDVDGYDVSYVSYDTKREAIDAAKARQHDDLREARRAARQAAE